MKASSYEQIISLLGNTRWGAKILNLINLAITAIVALFYLLFLLYLVINKDLRFWNSLLIPAVSFALVSFWRKVIDAARPYQVLKIQPLFEKDTKGQSFPSRHVFSAFVIATTIYPISHLSGVFLWCLGVILAIVRVAGGVHFFRDVVVGAMIGFGCGLLNFYF